MTETTPIGLLPPEPVTRFEGWRSFVNRPALVRPIVPTPAEWESMSKAARAESKADRIRWHGRLPLTKTSTLVDIIRDTIQMASLNYGAVAGVRPGFVLDGLPTVGKSTILMELGRQYEISVRKKFNLGPLDNAGLDIFLPVLYITLTGTIAVKPFNRLLMDFYGIPLPKSTDESEMTARIVETARRCGTTLILIDDFHFLRMTNRSAQVVNNHVKSLASSISATFGYAGIDLAHSGLLAEGNSEARRELSQTDHRFVWYGIRPYGVEHPDFEMILRGLGRSLCLVNSGPDDLVKIRKYVHARTNGFMGAISMLMRKGANLAIRDGSERITQKLLERVRLDHAAESHRLVASRR